MRPANNCLSQRTWLHLVSAPTIKQSFAASFKIPARHKARLSRQKTRAGSAVLQAVFYVMVFAANTLALLYFFINGSLLIKCIYKKVNKCSRRQEAKTHAIKNCLKLFYIMWPYGFASHFLAWLMQACSTKNPIRHIMYK